MAIRRRGKKGIFLFEMRVPKRFCTIEEREFVRHSLGTADETLANRKHDQTKQLLIAQWEAATVGRTNDVERYQRAIVKLCRASGFDYLATDSVAELPLSSLLDRTDGVSGGDVPAAGALLGGEGLGDLPVSELRDAYEETVKAELTGKSAKQIQKWRNDRDMILREFLEVCGDMLLREVAREHASKYRRSLTERLVAGELVENSANRRMQALGRMVNDVLWDRYGLRTTAFKEMGWREKKKKRRNTQVSYSPNFIRSKILAPGVLDRLNEDARDILLVALNTGAGPSELVNLKTETIHLEAEVPYIDIRPDGRELKNVYRERQIPLVGLSLEAMARHPAGFKRYENGDSLSNLVNKYLKNNGLKESPDHTLKSLRHSFRDALRNAGCPDSIAEELMGHVQEGTVYGEGVWMETAKDWLEKIAY